MYSNQILISDTSLRDGNHAVAHQISKTQIEEYCIDADKAGVAIIEVGHGNGLGASSIQVGLAKISDTLMLETARKNIVKGKLGIHVIPGFATIKRDLINALKIGVDVVRVASHCTEADITQRHLEFVRESGKEAIGVLMMSHLATPQVLLEEAQKMELYGAEGIIIMDSAGAYLPFEVKERIQILVNSLNIPVGFHAHNNLGMAIANSIAAIESGAKILDASIRGFGAGAGNAQLEVLVAVLEKMNIITGINLYKILDAADNAEKKLIPKIPTINSNSIVSGLAGVFSGFSKHVDRISAEFNVDPRDVYYALGKRKVVGGQEDLIYEVALEISIKNKK
ncbi:MAG: 4-hydroxy-2-oxovalerate aldolase [Sediminibacterium sp.]|nr:4-hydroxy-2-oxovalerate aldolase [Sediminibacterium sp.]